MKIRTSWLKALGFISTILLPALAQADDFELWLETQSDSQDSREYAVELGWGFTPDDRLLWRAATLELPFGTDPIEATLYAITWQSYRIPSYRFALGYDVWDQTGELHLQTARLDFDYLRDSWSIGVNLDYRWMRFYSLPINNAQFDVDLQSLGYGLTWRGQTGHWLLEGFSTHYQYNEDPSRLNTLRALRFLGARTLAGVGDLNAWWSGVEVGYRALTLHYSRAHSAINQLDSDTYAARLQFRIAKSWSIDVETGQQQPQRGESTTYNRLSLGVHF